MATPVKFGSEFLVNTTLAFDQFAPTITGLADGRFMVAWANGSATYPSFPGSGDDAGFAIRAQMYNADGSTFGTEFLAGAATGGYRSTPTTTALIGGRFVVAWTDEDTTATDTNAAIRAQIYNPDGSAFGGVIQLNTTTTGVQAIPSISALANGGFVATWQDYSLSGGDTSAWAVRGQQFNADGTVFGAEFLVNTHTTNEQFQPTVTGLSNVPGLANGRFVVSWSDYSQTSDDTSGSAIRAQMFNADGTPFHAEFKVNTTTLSYQLEPTVASLTGGGFVVAWTDYSATGADNFSYAIRAQVFDVDGSAVGTEFVANTIIDYHEYQPTITGILDGRFVVVWTDYSRVGGDTSVYAVRAQLFNADGSKSGDEFLANTTTVDRQQHPTVTALADGRFVVAYEDSSRADGGPIYGNYDVRAQIFDPREAAVNLHGTGLNDNWVGTKFRDTMDGNSGNDSLVGGAGNDLLFSGKGDDQLFGGLGNDELFGGFSDTGTKQAYGGAGDDVFQFVGGGNVQLFGGAGNDSVSGYYGRDTLLGGTGNDRVEGNAGDDSLYGGAGNDTLVGGGEIDTITGGLGNDSFQFSEASHGGDVITDFHATFGDDDFFVIRGFVFGGGLMAGILAATQFQTRSDNVAQDLDDRFIFRTTDKTLWFDSNGSLAGGLTMIADLQNNAVVTAGDILII